MTLFVTGTLIGLAAGAIFHLRRTREMRQAIVAQNAQLTDARRRDKAQIEALNASNEQLAAANRKARNLERALGALQRILSGRKNEFGDAVTLPTAAVAVRQHLRLGKTQGSGPSNGGPVFS